MVVNILLSVRNQLYAISRLRSRCEGKVEVYITGPFGFRMSWLSFSKLTRRTMSCGRKGGCNILTGSHHGLLFCSYLCAGHFWSDHHKFRTLVSPFMY